MESSLEQRYAIKFCSKLNKSLGDTHKMLVGDCGESSLSYFQHSRWLKAFTEGREEVVDESRSGRPSSSSTDENLDRVRDLLNSDRRLSVWLIVDTLNILKTIVHELMSEKINMRKVCAKLVPKVLTDDEKIRRVAVPTELFERVEMEPDFFNNVITGDETWCFEYDPETKRQSSEWHTPESPKPKKVRMSKSKVKTMLIVFLDAKSVVHKEFLPQGQTANAAYYEDVLERLRKRVLRERKDIAATWVLHHDNAPSHTALRVRGFQAKHNLATLPQSSYSPDMAPADFFLFSKIKTSLKGTRFGTIEAIQRAATRALNEVPVEAFQHAYRAWQSRWQKCIDAQGQYFEEF